MECHRVVLVDSDALGEVEVTADVLREGDAAEGVLAVVVLLAVCQLGDDVEQVARCLDVESDGVGVLSVGLFAHTQ